MKHGVERRRERKRYKDIGEEEFIVVVGAFLTFLCGERPTRDNLRTAGTQESRCWSSAQLEGVPALLEEKVR